MTTSFFARAAVLALLALAGACAPPPPPPPAPQQIPVPDPAEVERVIFLVGDPGAARMDYYPIMPRLQRDIEYWAEQLATDSAVAVLFLGDIVYPLGLHPPGHELFPHDSAIVMDQVRLLAGPFGRQHHARGYFIAGNHDWGLEEEWEGYVRLKTLADFLEMARGYTQADVRLVPEAGTGGPQVVDLGQYVRLLMLDTAWWILDGGEVSGAQRSVVLERIAEAMRTAGGRQVLIAAHHPLKSAGPHGGEFNFWQTFGARYLLARSGAILQDLTSRPYRELERGLREIFAETGAPLAFVGGHEHSLQIIQAMLPNDPQHNIVSGSASKLSEVFNEPGLRFGMSAPGYMRLIVEKDGGMSVFVEATPERYQSCPKKDPERARCMSEGIAAFGTVHSQRLR